MSGLFGGGAKPPPPQAPPAPPTVANSQSQLDQAAAMQAQTMQRGRSSTMLTGGAGVADLGTTSKQLLGN